MNQLHDDDDATELPIPEARDGMDSDADAFVKQCEADYRIAEITTVAHLPSDKTKPPTHLLAVVELLHKHLEANPLVGLGPEADGYPRWRNLSAQGGTVIVQRWHLSVSEGIAWYRACAEGSMAVPNPRKKPTVVPLGQLGDDPPWPHHVIETDLFWEHCEFWGARPGGSRWHRLLRLDLIDVTKGWKATDVEKAREFLLAEIHIDLLSRSVLVGSCHLRLPNPVFRSLDLREGSDGRSILVDVDAYPNASCDDLELIYWNRRAWGATSVQNLTLKPGMNVLPMPEGVERGADSVRCKKRGLLAQTESFGFFRAFEISMTLVSEQRRVAAPKGDYTVGVSGDEPIPIHVGTPRPEGALSRLAEDQARQQKQAAWAATAFQWFDKDSVAGTLAIREIIQTASKAVELLDPYFGRDDLLEFALATTRRQLPFRVLTSHDFCTSREETDVKREFGDALAEALDSVRAQDSRLNIVIKVMPGQKSPVHDRFLIVDGTVWVLGASLNEFGSRGTLLMKLPANPETFSVLANIFEPHWASSTALGEWVAQRAAVRRTPPTDDGTTNEVRDA